MKKLFPCLLCIALSLFSLIGCGSKEESVVPSEEEAVVPSEEETDTTLSSEDEYLEGLHHVEIEIEDYGMISLELDADTAPISVTNFIQLAKDGFYDGLTFHRIISGFMIQGGDPLGNGMGGSSKMIQGEFSANGIENDISHVRGVISMARSNDPDSASSQFFIVHQDSLFLDGNYAAFGHVTEGMDVVDKICESVPVVDDNGTVQNDAQPIITSIKVID